MAGEYYKWLAKDVKPEEKRELTREEKLRNWWHYHKWHLLIAAVVIFLVIDIGSDMLADYRDQPDYSIAYVGSSYLPEDTVQQLTDALAELGQDLNGRGGVQVALRQYIIYPLEGSGQEDLSVNQTMLYAAQVQLAADMENCDSFFYLMEDPRQFQEDYEILVGLDGTDPVEGEALYLSWEESPLLAQLPLGTYTVDTLEGTYTGSSRDVVSGLYIGRRGFWQGKTCEDPEGCEALWNRILGG